MLSRQPLSRIYRVLITVIVLELLPCALPTSAARGQLQTLSAGNADRQWREAQLQALDSQLADAKLPEELKREIEAQRAWLKAWDPKSPGAAAAPSGETPADQPAEGQPDKAQDKETKALEEPTIDPDGEAEDLRKRLFDAKRPATAADTKALQAALTKHSGDIGLRQLQLHWIDQPNYRDAHWQEIATAADRVLALLSDRPATEETKAAAAFANYRKARALAHALRGRPLRDAQIAEAGKLSDERREEMQNAIGECWRQVETLVGAGQSAFFELELYHLRRYGWNGQALELLKRNAGALDTLAYLGERRSILQALGWSAPAVQTAALIKAHKPTTKAEPNRAMEIQYVPLKSTDSPAAAEATAAQP